MENKRENFGGRFAALIAMAGSAIGLGCIWRFPYLVGENGGAAFIVVFILSSVFLAMPIFFSEAILGRRAQANSFRTIRNLTTKKSAHLIGFITLITPLVILSYYSVVGGWSVKYLVHSCTTGFADLPQETLSGIFGGFISSAWAPLIFHTIFMVATAYVVSSGVKAGIEKCTKYSMPLLFVLIVVIMVYSLSLPNAAEGVRYVIKPDFAKLTPRAIATAMGQSFFAMSLGAGMVLIYASYMKKEDSLATMGFGSLGFSLLFAVIAVFAIMPALFSAGVEPGSGPGLVFETLPYVFSKMSASAPVLGRIVAILFFLTVVLAALTSSISLFEVGVAYCVEEKKMTRRKASNWIFAGCWLLGVFCSLSYGPLSEVRIFGLNIFEFCDYSVSNVLMVLGALFFTLLAGWKMDKSVVRQEFTNNGKLRASSAIFNTMYFFIKYIAPISILIIFVNGFIK